ncbi:MAG TPA: hypothetical protein VFB12_18660 [Ktedonobacteraceae bacterium]|nr:hypothetical protein [Ktedonobacteraceae bacterium]
MASEVVTIKLHKEDTAFLPLLRKYGCIFEPSDKTLIVTFPPGTTRQFKIRITYTYHYYIRLPDGVTFKEFYSGNTERSSLALIRPTFPTFKDLFYDHELHLTLLSQQSGVALHVLDAMYEGKPVPYEDAVQVLATVTLNTGIQYSLDNVDIVTEPP